MHSPWAIPNDPRIGLVLREVRRNGLGRVSESVEQAAPSAHVHKWGAWDARWVLDNYEKRYCACGAFQARPISRA